MIFERVDRDDLFDAIQINEGFPEDKAVHIIRQLVDAIYYLHERNIVHRDIKPENVLVQTTMQGDTCIKLADFGYACSISDPNEQMTQLVGTYEYFSPEQLMRKNYDRSVDVWSLGVTCFGVLCARCLFYDEDEEKTRKQALAGDLKYLEGLQCSENAKDFMRKLLTFDPTKRMTIAQARVHPWISNPHLLLPPSRPLAKSPFIERTKPKNLFSPLLSPLNKNVFNSGLSPLSSPLRAITNLSLNEGKRDVKRVLFIEEKT